MRFGRRSQSEPARQDGVRDVGSPCLSPAEAMARIVAAVAPTMKAEGFRKRRHTFNRRVGEDGFVQVLNFQMGAFNPPGTVEVPGLRPNLYGRFTVNLGVFVPAIHRGDLTERDWYSDYHCQLRKRIGELLPERSDVWWRLDHPDAEVDVAAAIHDEGLPWLSQFENHSGLLRLWNENGQTSVGLDYPAAPLDIADVLLHVGRRADAEVLLRDYVGRAHVAGHTDVVRTYLTERDFATLAEGL